MTHTRRPMERINYPHEQNQAVKNWCWRCVMYCVKQDDEWRNIHVWRERVVFT
jgi:hypothetical protein